METSKVVYNPWPLGHIPEELQRPELRQLKETGYQFDDAREVVDIFEKKVAAFFGAPYAVSTDCCTHALELCLHETLIFREKIKIPKHTYISVAQTIEKTGNAAKFIDLNWHGYYALGDTNIIDAATVWKKGSYIQGHLMCISFQIKKTIPIGRGGVILLEDKNQYEAFKLLRYDGRDMSLPYNHPEHIKSNGYHYYLSPEDCARGILLMDRIKTETYGQNWTNYPDISKMI